MRKWLLLISVLVPLVSACKIVDALSDTAGELFGGEIVAKAGEHKLHRSQLESYIPHGVSPEDSINLARQYIEAWAEDLLMLDMAEEQLSKAEKDVSRELEEYRRTLLKYRYEQRYIDQRLDTLVTPAEITAFYKDYPEKFRLERPVIKARYVIIPAESKSIKKIRSLMSSDDEAEVMDAATLAETAAIKFVDQADTWTDALVLAREMGMDYQTLLGARSSIAEYTDEAGNLHMAYIAEMVAAGKVAPEEYCTERIRDLILSTRKHNLERSLERDLLEDARKNNKFVIY